jgi:hypothetical protein
MKIFFTNNWLNPIFNDAPKPWQIGFQDGATPTMEGIVELIFMWLSIYIILLNLSIYWKVYRSLSINYKQVEYIEQSVGNINLLQNKWNLRDYKTETKQIDLCINKTILRLNNYNNNYSLVKYGSNKSTWVSSPLAKIILLRIISPLAKRTKSVLIGLMLSDGLPFGNPIIEV